MSESTVTMTLTEFLLARLDEMEAVARDARDCTPPAFGPFAAIAFPATDYLTVDPDFLLADVEAKRQVLAAAAALGANAELAFALILVQPYADHPDFNPGWRTDVRA